MTGATSMHETVEQLRVALRDYIEATYHISNAALVRARRQCLDVDGVIAQSAYVESTPRYIAGSRYAELEMPDTARKFLTRLGRPDTVGEALLHDPPYAHQSQALEAIAEGRSLLVMTGTGSGKTETFLLPTLANLAAEAAEDPRSFQQSAVRALMLYPMNALVNDQLARLRLLIGDPKVRDAFLGWAGRPARFARYTSRTLYPGVRTEDADRRRLKSIDETYLTWLRASRQPGAGGDAAAALVKELRERGKWPAKHDLEAWYGKGTRWLSHGAFARANPMPQDAELFTRHEVLQSPPDLLVTNYSMLEYTLMRPLERNIYDATRAWLAENRQRRFMLIIDEAHLYRGTGGAEVALLLRRLRSRLGIDASRLQVICTSASFSDPDVAKSFAAQLTGKDAEDFDVITGQLDYRSPASPARQREAEAWAAFDLDRFFEADNEQARQRQFEPLRQELGLALYSAGDAALGSQLHHALRDYAPLNLAVNLTMEQALTLDELRGAIFPDAEPAVQDRALTALLTLGGLAREKDGQAGLFPCRVHTFFRGLPGLWACLDPQCRAQIDGDLGSGNPVGRLYAQPRAVCECGARVFELFTCRHCGSAYCRAYTDDIEDPRFLWSEPGDVRLSFGWENDLKPIDLLLERTEEAFEAGRSDVIDLDLLTGRLNPETLGNRVRTVGLRPDRSQPPVDPDENERSAAGATAEFVPCGVCGKRAGYGRSSVQDHQTKGDEPFQALVKTQLLVQPPAAKPASEFAPLRGRKVLTFADSRQIAARLAPRLQSFSMRDVLRPVLIAGWTELLSGQFGAALTFEHLPMAACVGAIRLGVRLRPDVKEGETFNLAELREVLAGEALDDPVTFTDAQQLCQHPPRALVEEINRVVANPFYGLEALGLASIKEVRRPGVAASIEKCSDLEPVLGGSVDKRDVVRVWLNKWAVQNGWVYGTTSDLDIDTERGPASRKSGWFDGLKPLLSQLDAKGDFKKQWLPHLLDAFTRAYGDKRVLKASAITLELQGPWAYCGHCRSTHRPLGATLLCPSCGSKTLITIDPATDEVFLARKRYYRQPVLDALDSSGQKPITIIAAEHTAQLNAPKSETVFSKAEQHELLFQDIDLSGVATNTDLPAIDVLSCTTTMEVGIDIGALSGVAMRNMPPARANYQQRAGRAGRRGNAIATVVAYAGSDTHDEHYFTNARDMIRGRVVDPALTMDNPQIIRRHVLAFLLQRFHLDRLDTQQMTDNNHQLFAVLGTVDGFMGGDPILNIQAFEAWLVDQCASLTAELEDWLPSAISADTRSAVVDHMVEDALASLKGALSPDALETLPGSVPDSTIDDAVAETQDEAKPSTGASTNVLDRLMYHGVLPKYAFPTDVVSFHVFETHPKRYRIEDRYAPSQGLAIALSQYAPGKEVWIDGKLWTSGAIFGAMPNERQDAWEGRTRYLECPRCHYATRERSELVQRREMRQCPACNYDRFGPARDWIRPPGFAHPHADPERVINEAPPITSYATRAQLLAPGPADAELWTGITPRLRTYQGRQGLLVTNTGPNREGYAYCLTCGRIEPMASSSGRLHEPHTKPYPARQPECPSRVPVSGLVLGTKFVSDVLLIALRTDSPVSLTPGELATDVALRTCAEALTLAAARLLEIEPGELQAEYRPALTGPQQNWSAEIYLYDTLAGGAGFAAMAADLGTALFREALRLLENCPASCDQSCYRCLRSFKNRFEHRLLDRHVGAGLLRYMLTEGGVEIPTLRTEAATTRLFEDLARLGLDLTVTRDVPLSLPSGATILAPIRLQTTTGTSWVVAVSAPLTPRTPPDPRLMELAQAGIGIVLVDEVRVTHNLPAATEHVLRSAGVLH